MKVILAFEDEELTNREKQMIMLNVLYPEVPEDIKQAQKKAIEFLDAGKESDENRDDEIGPRLFSFAQDANYIFAAFKQTHNVDLESIEYLHWWKFQAFFMDLGSNTTFLNLVNLRRRIKNGTASREEKRVAREMGEIFDIQELDTRTAEEKEKEIEFMALVGEGIAHGK